MDPNHVIMCVSKTLVAIKQGEFPGGKVLGDAALEIDKTQGPTLHTHNALFPSQQS